MMKTLALIYCGIKDHEDLFNQISDQSKLLLEKHRNDGVSVLVYDPLDGSIVIAMKGNGLLQYMSTSLIEFKMITEFDIETLRPPKK